MKVTKCIITPGVIMGFTPRISFRELWKVQKLNFGDLAAKYGATEHFNVLFDAMARVRNAVKVTDNEATNAGHIGFIAGENIYCNSDLNVTDKLFERLKKMGDFKSFIDLGCGMLDVVFNAKIRGFDVADGIESNFIFREISKVILKKLSIILPFEKGVNILNGDFRDKTDFSVYDVFYLYPDKNEKTLACEHRFAMEANPGSVFVIHKGIWNSDLFRKYFDNLSPQFYDLDMSVYRRNNIPFE